MIDALLSASQPKFVVGRWIFLRGLGLVFLTVFVSLARDIHGLIGPHGLFPASEWLASVRWRSAPTLLRLGASDHALTLVVVVGGISAVALLANVQPRIAALGCAVALVSFLGACAPAIPPSEPDGLLMESAIIAAIIAPPGRRPGFAAQTPAPRVGWLLLLWLWFRLYFESGMSKLTSDDPSWRHLEALHTYFETQPFPTALAWHVHNGPRWLQSTLTLLTLCVEVGAATVGLVVARARRWVFLIVTLFQLGLLLTGNYGSLGYLAIVIGVVLLHDDALRRVHTPDLGPPVKRRFPVETAFAACLAYASLAVYAPHGDAWYAFPSRALGKFRLGNRFDLFDSVPRERLLLELQGSTDHEAWRPFLLEYTPQDLRAAPPWFAPYQPRFDWNLWLCTRGRDPDACPLVRAAAQRRRETDVRALFREVPDATWTRMVVWKYVMTTPDERARTGALWRRELLRTEELKDTSP